MPEMVYFAAMESGRPHLPRMDWIRLEKAARRSFLPELRDQLGATFLMVIDQTRADRQQGTERGLALVRARRVRSKAAKARVAIEAASERVDRLLAQLDQLDLHTLASIQNEIPGGEDYDTTLSVRLTLHVFRTGPATTDRLDKLANLECGAAAAEARIEKWAAANPGQPASIVAALVWSLGPIFRTAGGDVSTSDDGPFARFIEVWHKLVPLALKHRARKGAKNPIGTACRHAVISFKKRYPGWLDQPADAPKIC